MRISAAAKAKGRAYTAAWAKRNQERINELQQIRREGNRCEDNRLRGEVAQDIANNNMFVKKWLVEHNNELPPIKYDWHLSHAVTIEEAWYMQQTESFEDEVINRLDSCEEN